MSLNNARYVAMDYNGEILLLEMYEKEINGNDYKQVWRISKSSPEMQLQSMLDIFLQCTRHEIVQRDSLAILVKISKLEEKVPPEMLKKVLPEHNIKIYNIFDKWVAERDLQQYRILGEGGTPIQAITNMKRIGRNLK